MNSASSLLWNLLADIPVFIALLAGMVFVVMRWKRSPKAALLALIGLVLLLLHMPIFEAIYALVPEIMAAGSASWNTFFFLGLINYSAMAFAFAFLLAAVFIARNQAQETGVLTRDETLP